MFADSTTIQDRSNLEIKIYQSIPLWGSRCCPCITSSPVIYITTTDLQYT